MSRLERVSRQKQRTKSRHKEEKVSYNVEKKEEEDDEEEISDYSFEVESGDFGRNPNIPKNRDKTSYDIKEEINSNSETEEDTTDIIRPRRSSILENKTSKESKKDSNEFRSDGAFKYDEIESPEVLERKRKRRLSRRRRSENRSLETSKDLEENRKKASSSRTHGISTFNSGERDTTTERSRKRGHSIQGKKLSFTIMKCENFMLLKNSISRFQDTVFLLLSNKR